MKFTTFDTETTGVDVYNDRIVTAFLGQMETEGPNAGQWIQTMEWLLNPGVEIPEGASAVHGITTERAQAEGRTDLAKAFDEMREIIQSECIRDSPLVIYNAPFDLTLLQTELSRHDVQQLDLANALVIDPFVLDKQLAPFRKGKRTLTTIAPLYGVPVEANAHDAGADCLMTGRIAIRQLAKFPNTSLHQLHNSQVAWKHKQAVSLQDYFRTKGGKPDAVVNPGWPVQTPVAA